MDLPARILPITGLSHTDILLQLRGEAVLSLIEVIVADQPAAEAPPIVWANAMKRVGSQLDLARTHYGAKARQVLPQFRLDQTQDLLDRIENGRFRPPPRLTGSLATLDLITRSLVEDRIENLSDPTTVGHHHRRMLARLRRWRDGWATEWHGRIKHIATSNPGVLGNIYASRYCIFEKGDVNNPKLVFCAMSEEEAERRNFAVWDGLRIERGETRT